MSETAQRAGHIPGATSAPWAQTVNEDGTFKDADALAAHYAAKGVTPDKDVIAYCRIGERSSHSWFVLHELLGYPQRQELRRLLDRVRLAHQRAHREGRRLPDFLLGAGPMAWRPVRQLDAGEGARPAAYGVRASPDTRRRGSPECRGRRRHPSRC